MKKAENKIIAFIQSRYELSNSDFARALGISQELFCKYKNNTRQFPLWRLLQLIELFKPWVTPNRLVDLLREEYPPERLLSLINSYADPKFPKKRRVRLVVRNLIKLREPPDGQ